MPTDPIGRLTRRFDRIVRAACEARFDDDDRFVCLRSDEFERYAAGEQSRLGAALPGRYVSGAIEPIVFLPPAQADSPPPSRRALPDPFYPAALPPRRTASSPDYYPEFRPSLTLQGNAMVLLIVGASILGLYKLFESLPSLFPESSRVQAIDPEDRAIELAAEADRERRAARDRDVESIVANWPEELSGYRTSARRIYAHMLAGEYGADMVLDLDNGRYLAERSDAGELRIVRIERRLPDPADQIAEERESPVP